jgi:hypothetical protein
LLILKGFWLNSVFQDILSHKNSLFTWDESCAAEHKTPLILSESIDLLPSWVYVRWQPNSLQCMDGISKV